MRRVERQARVHDLRVEGAPIRVAIAEDSALTHEAISRLIEESGGTVAKAAGEPGTARRTRS
jgi:hypothetical protein